MKNQYVFGAVVVLVLGTVVMTGFAPNEDDEKETVKTKAAEEKSSVQIFEDVLDGLQDEFDDQSYEGVTRTEDGIEAQIHGPTILKVGDTTKFSVQLRNKSLNVQPEAPFDFHQKSREMLTAGPITLGELSGPGSPEVRTYSYKESGATHALFDVTCTDVGPATITLSSKGTSDIESPPDNYTMTIDFHLQCVEEYEGEIFRSETYIDAGSVISVGTEYPDAELQFVLVYTIDGVPYAQGQFQLADPEDARVGCPFYHAHSTTVVYPFTQWVIRGHTDKGLQTSAAPALNDPAPKKCGYGVDNTLGPKSVLVPKPHLIEVCKLIDFEGIEPVSDFDIRDTDGLYNLCELLVNES